jgi:RNA polymerase-binding transcription factor DksA
VGDVADKAFERTRAEVEHDLIEHSLRELAEIAAVRERVENGTYGECVACGEPIAPARLEAYPTARRCAACQERHERLGRTR